MKSLIKKLCYFVLLTPIIIPFQSFAATNPDGSPIPRAVIVDESNTYQPVGVSNNSQAYGITGSGVGLSAGGAASSFATCLAASGLTGMVRNSISSMLGSAIDIFRVPTSNTVTEGKETGTLLTAGISWDQMGWCLVNSLIESIGDATVAWINSGFQGNPVFVDDPGQFFADVADIQAGIFLNDVTGGLLCTPIQNWVKINLANNYNNNINSSYGSCSFSEISGNLDQFMSGESFGWTDWLSYTQNPYNNPYGATIYGQIELDKRIASALDLQQNQLNWSAGFLSKKDPETGKITSPGSVIESQVNQRLFSGQRRLEIADEFDEVVNALVNQLIKVAISEMTERR